MAPDETARIHRLIWIHAGRKHTMILFLWSGSIIFIGWRNMYRVPDYYRHVSRQLSQVMGEIGLNEKTVNVRRRTGLLRESMHTVRNEVCGRDYTCYYFGSQTEGTTTLGLNSDTDVLSCDNTVNVISNWGEWKQGQFNLLMIQDDTAPPGYCRLQALRPDIPVAVEHLPDQDYEYDDQRRVLMKNSFFMEFMGASRVRNGPAQTDENINLDSVYAFAHRSLPRHAEPWIVRRCVRNEHGRNMIRDVLQNGCFIVPTGHSYSTTEYLEWRISTSMAERCVMFNMNITQLRCYTLLKIIIKTFITPGFPDTISSFHCKTVIMHCIENTPYDLWNEDNLLLCVTICLHLLHQCIITNRCPHYFIPGNNLLEGRIDGRIRRNIAIALKHILYSNGDFILKLRLDDIGDRLVVRLCPIASGGMVMMSQEQIEYMIYSQLYYDLINSMLSAVEACNIDAQLHGQLLQRLYANGTSTERCTVAFMIPSLCNTMASSLASNCIQHGQVLSAQVLSLFALGIDSDVSSGRLKLASAFYCSGDFEGTEMILRDVKERYYQGSIQPCCSCMSTELGDSRCRLPLDITRNESLNYIRSCFAFGVVFTRDEILCVPPGLRYEMFRCTEEDIVTRDEDKEKWMDCAAVDSVSYLFYLQYLTYGRLGRQLDQQRALDELITTILVEPWLFHRETATNLLGQCMELEGRLLDALECYRYSLNIKPTHNVARWHIVHVLMKLYNNA